MRVRSLCIKIFSVIVLVFMVFTLVHSLIITPAAVIAVQVNFGEKFYNGNKTKYICVCGDNKDCLPCIALVPEE